MNACGVKGFPGPRAHRPPRHESFASLSFPGRESIRVHKAHPTTGIVGVSPLSADDLSWPSSGEIVMWTLRTCLFVDLYEKV